MSVQRMPTFREEPEAALAFFHEHGYQIEPNVWTVEQLDQLAAASQKLPSFQDGTCSPTMHPHNLDPVFLSALRNQRIVGIMEKLLAGKISGIQSEFFHGKPGTLGFARHQDNFYVEAARDAFASAWSPLVDVSPANGGLIIWPGSQRESILPIETVDMEDDPGQDKNARRQQVVVPDRYKPLDVIASAGDVVFIHGYLVHASHNNRSGGYRRVLLCTYLRSGEKFRPGFHAKRAEVDVYAV